MTGLSFLPLLAALFFLVDGCATGLAQGDSDLQARFKKMDESSSLIGEGMKPWHLKMKFQLFRADGKPGDTGTIEEWWADTKHFRIVYSMPTFVSGSVESGDETSRTPGDHHVPYFVPELLRQATNPLSNQDVGLVELTNMQAKAIKLDCLKVLNKKEVASKFEGFVPTYCTEPGKETLLLSSEFETESIARTKEGKFRERLLPLTLEIRVGGKAMATGQIVQLQGQALPYPETADTTGLERQPRIAVAAATTPGGNIVKKFPPVYPPMAKLNHISGAVIIAVVIGKDGKTRSPEVVLSSHESLSQAALDCVKQWVYAPYVVDGVPTEVDTVVTVHFKLGTAIGMHE